MKIFEVNMYSTVLILFFYSFLKVNHCIELGIPGNNAARLIMFFGMASFVGRLVTGRLGDCKCVNSLYMVQASFLTLAVFILLLPLARSYIAFVLFSLVAGYAYGAGLSQVNLLLLTTVSPTLRAIAFGYGTCLVSFSIMIGPSLAGEFHFFY